MKVVNFEPGETGALAVNRKHIQIEFANEDAVRDEALLQHLIDYELWLIENTFGADLLQPEKGDDLVRVSSVFPLYEAQHVLFEHDLSFFVVRLRVPEHFGR